jgi:hypothetical protein
MLQHDESPIENGEVTNDECVPLSGFVYLFYIYSRYARVCVYVSSVFCCHKNSCCVTHVVVTSLLCCAGADVWPARASVQQ